MRPGDDKICEAGRDDAGDGGAGRDDCSEEFERGLGNVDVRPEETSADAGRVRCGPPPPLLRGPGEGRENVDEVVDTADGDVGVRGDVELGGGICGVAVGSTSLLELALANGKRADGEVSIGVASVMFVLGVLSSIKDANAGDIWERAAVPSFGSSRSTVLLPILIVLRVRLWPMDN